MSLIKHCNRYSPKVAMEELLCRWPGGLSLLVGGSATQHLVQYYPLSHQQPSLLTQFESEHLSYGSESRPSPQGSSVDTCFSQGSVGNCIILDSEGAEQL